MLYQVKDNKITLRSVPHTYTHEDGSQTVGYNLLSAEELAQDGWIEVVEVKPEYNIETEYLIQDKEEIVENKVIITYSSLPIKQHVRLVTEEEKYRDMVNQLFSAYLTTFTV